MLEMLLDDRFSELAATTAAGWFRESALILAPPLFYPEVTSAIRRRVYSGALGQAEASAALDVSLAWRIAIWDDSKSIQRRAYDLATRLNRPSVYDAQYLAVAQLLGCELWTADERLYNAVRSQFGWVRWIGAAA